MTNFFYNLILEPIITIYEIVYGITRQIIFETPLFEEVLILSILVVSIVFNMLTYPLYKKADIIQNETRIKKEKMSKWVEHIKKNFKGDERYFILSAYRGVASAPLGLSFTDVRPFQATPFPYAP